MTDCVFCGIAAGDVPAARVLESPSPQVPVHVLVIPREHHPDLASLATVGDGLLDELVAQAQLVASETGVAETGYRVVFNTGPQAGQAVQHAHAHVLGGRPLAWPPG